MHSIFLSPNSELMTVNSLVAGLGKRIISPIGEYSLTPSQIFGNTWRSSIIHPSLFEFIESLVKVNLNNRESIETGIPQNIKLYWVNCHPFDEPLKAGIPPVIVSVAEYALMVD